MDGCSSTSQISVLSEDFLHKNNLDERFWEHVFTFSRTARCWRPVPVPSCVCISSNSPCCFGPPGYVTMGAVTPGHWSQQAFAAQTPLAFGVQSPLGPVAQVLPGGQPLIWSQANIFPATQQQWAAMAAGAFSPTAYLPAQPVGTLPAAMFQTLAPVAVTPGAESHSGPGASSSAPSPSASSSPQHGERARKMGKELFKVRS